jgi:uncharacterized protein (DUF305 family)
MNKNILYAFIGLLVGSAITWIALSGRLDPNASHVQMMRSDSPSSSMMGSHGMNMSMEEMSDSLKALTGDDFDKAFIEMMIDHHQGAIDMANLAKTNAKHQEIKDLSDDIVSAQSTEIQQMRDWQRLWNY